MTWPSEKLLAWVMQDSASPASVAFQLEKYATIQRGVMACTLKQQEAAARYDAECKEINDRRTAIRGTCDHPDTTYCGDPSGGTTCNICGAEL